MADINKILKIDLKVDVGEASKLISVEKEILTTTDKIAAASSHLNIVTAKRQALIEEVTKAYERTLAVTTRANEIASQYVNQAGIAEANVQRSLDATNRKMQEKLANIRALQVEEQKLQRIINQSTVSPYLGGTSTASVSPGNRVNEQAQEVLRQQRIQREQATRDRELAIIQNFNAATESIEREAAARRTFITQSETNSRRVLYSQMFDQIEARERQNAVNTQSFAQRIASVPRVGSQGSQIDITGAMTRGLQQQIQRENELTTALNNTTRAQQNANNAGAAAIPIHRNLFVRIGELVGIYRLWTTSITLIKNALLEIPRAGLEQQATQANLLGIFGTEKGAENIQFIRDVAEKAGQSLVTLEQAYRRYAPSAILAGAKQKEVNQSFKDFAEVGTILHLPEEKINSLFLALDQMYAKGVVQSEEVKKQLGNVLPGAVEVFANAMGKTPAAFMAAMKANEVIAKEAVPKFAAYYRKIFGGPDDSVFRLVADRLQSNLFRLESHYTLLNRAIFADTQDTMDKIVKASIDMVDSVTRNLKGIEQSIELLATVIGTRLVSGGLILAITNFELLALKANNFIKILTGLNIPTIAIASSIAYLTTKQDGLSLSYTESEGILISYKDKQVELTEYLKAFALQVYSDLSTGIGNLDKSTKTFTDYLGNNSTKSMTAFIDTITKFAALMKTLDERQWSLLGNTNFGEEFKKNLVYFKTIPEDIKKETDNIDKVMEAALLASQNSLIASFNGKSAKLVQEAIKNGKLTARAIQVPYKTLQDTQDSIIKRALSGTVDIPATEIGGNNLEDITSKTDKLSNAYTNITKQLKNQIDSLKTATDYTISQIEKARDNFQTNVAVQAAQKTPLAPELVNKTLQEYDLQILTKKKQLNIDIANLQKKALEDVTKTSEKSMDSLEKAYSTIKQIESSNGKNILNPTTAAIGNFQLLPSTIQKPGFGLEGPAIDQTLVDMENRVRKLHKELTEADKKALTDYAIANQESLDTLAEQYFNKLYERYNHNMLKAVAAYHAGFGNIDKGKIGPATQTYVKEFASRVDIKGVQEEEALATDLKQTYTDIAKVQQDAHAVNNKAIVEVAQLTAKQLELIQRINLEYAQAQGPTLESQILSLIAEKEERILELKKAGVNVSTTLLDKLYEQKIVQLQIKDLEEKANIIQQEQDTKYTNALNRINVLVNIGAKTQLQAAIEATAQNNIKLAAMREEINLKQQAQILDNPLNNSYRERAILIKNMTNEMELFALKANEVANLIQTALANSFDNAFVSFVNGSQTATQAFQSFAKSIVDEIAKIIAAEVRVQAIKGIVSLFGSMSSSSGLTGSIQQTNAGNFFSANGNIFPAGNISKYSGTIVDKPTMFATGGNIMGEAGPEAILPLKRNSQGKLGVVLENSGQSGGNVYNIQVSVTSGKEDKPADTGDKIAQAIIRSIAREEINKAARPGNTLNKTTAFG